MSFAAGQRNLHMAPEEYARRLWDWTPLNECFRRKIRLTDIDGSVEIGGEFLELEGKPPGGDIPTGQALYLFRKVRLGIRVVVLEGFPPNNVTGWLVLRNRRKTMWPRHTEDYGKTHIQDWVTRRYVGTYEDFKRVVRTWAFLASRGWR